MTGKSHLTAGTALTIAALQQGHYLESPSLGLFVAIAVGMVTSLLPDSDTPNPLLRNAIHAGGRPQLASGLFYGRRRRSLLYASLAALERLVRGVLVFLLGIVPGLVKHRGPTHYLLTAVTLTGLLWLVSASLQWSPMYTLAFGVGYLSHIWCDTMTRSGVPLFGPLSGRKIHSLPYPLRLRTERRTNLGEVTAVLLIILLATSAFFIPDATHYLVLVTTLIVSMFVVTAVDSVAGRKKQQRRQG